MGKLWVLVPFRSDNFSVATSTNPSTSLANRKKVKEIPYQALNNKTPNRNKENYRDDLKQIQNFHFHSTCWLLFSLGCQLTVCGFWPDPQDGLLFVLGFVVVEVLLASAVKISASGFITRWWNWSPNDCSGRGEQFKVRDVIRKKRDYVGKIPKLGGWVWPKPTSWCLLTKLFLACQNDSEVLKHVLQKGGRWYLINFNT